MSAEHSEADLSEVKERDVPAAFRSRPREILQFLDSGLLRLFVHVYVLAVNFHLKMSSFLPVRQVALCNLPTVKADLEHVSCVQWRRRQCMSAMKIRGKGLVQLNRCVLSSSR